MSEIERLKQLIDELQHQLEGSLSSQQLLAASLVGTWKKTSGGKHTGTVCSFCGKSQEQVRKVIAGPGVFICDECVDLCQEILDEEPLEFSPSLSSIGLVSEQEGRICSFCGKAPEQVQKLIGGPAVNVCDECIELCQEILNEELVRDGSSLSALASSSSDRASNLLVQESKLHCHFCGKSEDDIIDIVTGRNVNICDECVQTCSEVLAERKNKGAS